MSECEREEWMRARNRSAAEIRMQCDTERARVEQGPCLETQRLKGQRDKKIEFYFSWDNKQRLPRFTRIGRIFQ